MLSAEQVCLIAKSDSTASPSVVSSIEGTSNPRSNETFSSFGDGACGEPLLAQHLLIDFSPNKQTDNNFVQKKICAFWNFLHSTPEIQNLIVFPENNTFTKLPSTTGSVSEENESESESGQAIDVGRTAVSMLEFCEEKGLIDRTFEAKTAESRCTLGSREYIESDTKARHKAEKKRCMCTTICTPCPGLMKKKLSVGDTPLQRLCNKMEAWDVKHPNVTSPPERYSIFGDGCCGEPLVAQHVSLDFTSKRDEIDNDFVERKVCSFWEFIRNTPEIQNLKAKPEKKKNSKPSNTEEDETTNSEPECPKVAEVEKTAVVMLDFIENKGLIDRTFETKMPQSKCTLGSREYKEGETVKRQKKKEKKKHVCTCTSVCVVPCPGTLKSAKPPADYLSPTRMLSRKMKEWDVKHPNCYAFHPLIQRFVRLWRYVQIVSDILTCLLSMICCQCVDAMPLSTSSSCGTKPSVQIFETQSVKPKSQLVDIGRSSGEPMRAQHLVIDFTPRREDTPEIQARCQQFWQFAKNQPELEGMMVQPAPDSERRLKDLSSSAIHQDSFPRENKSALPAIHMMKKADKKGILKAALEAGEVNKYYS